MNALEMWNKLQQNFKDKSTHAFTTQGDEKEKSGKQLFVFMDKSSASQPEFLNYAKLEADS